MKVCGIVVWYNPGPEELDNIATYIDSIDRLIIIDNSDKDNSSMLAYISKNISIEYIANMENLGIASALNIGCERAIDMGYEWVLTMDQDSRFEDLMVNKYIDRCMQKLNEDKNIAIFGLKVCEDENEECGYVNRVITSGNLLNLKVYKSVGGFDVELFIDEVDHDMCFKIIEKGHKIYKFSDIRLEHKVGDTKQFKIFNKEFSTMNHNHIRKYYIIRNRCILKQRYPRYTQLYTKQNIVYFVKVILAEQDKMLKMKYMIKGYLDYKKGKLGKINI